jgi:RHS repeat-associated protein
VPKLDVISSQPDETTYKSGLKNYELSNHLGNVLVAVTDRKIAGDRNSDTYIDFVADYVSIADYYPFGMQQVGRTWQGGGYRYGFNGQEKDDDIAGDGDYLAYSFRLHNARLGRFLSVDPLSQEYPWNSSYSFAENSVISCRDLEGREKEFYKDRYKIASGELDGPTYNKAVNYWTGNGMVMVGMGAGISLLARGFVYASGVTAATWATQPQNQYYVAQTFDFALNLAIPGPDDILGLPGPGDVWGNAAEAVYRSHIMQQAFKKTDEVLKVTNKILHHSYGLVKTYNLAGSPTLVKRNALGMAYQSYLTGKAYINGYIEEFVYKNVHFDGYINGILIESKDGGPFFKGATGELLDWCVNAKSFNYGSELVKEANAQIAAAAGTKLQWINSSEDALESMYKYLKNNGVDVDKIEFRHVPKPE